MIGCLNHYWTVFIQDGERMMIRLAERRPDDDLTVSKGAAGPAGDETSFLSRAGIGSPQLVSTLPAAAAAAATFHGANGGQRNGSAPERNF